MKKFIIKAAVAASAFTPFVAFATNITTFEGLIARFNSILAVLFPFIIALAVLVILWGLFNYIAGAGDEEKRAQAKQYIIWGIIGLFVMVSIWGLVRILEGTFKLNNTVLPSPGFPAANVQGGVVVPTR